MDLSDHDVCKSLISFVVFVLYLCILNNLTYLPFCNFTYYCLNVTIFFGIYKVQYQCVLYENQTVSQTRNGLRNHFIHDIIFKQNRGVTCLILSQLKNSIGIYIIYSVITDTDKWLFYIYLKFERSNKSTISYLPRVSFINGKHTLQSLHVLTPTKLVVLFKAVCLLCILFFSKVLNCVCSMRLQRDK